METLHPLVSFCYYIAAIAVTVLIRNPAVTLGALVGGLCHWAFLTNAKEKRADLGFWLPLALLVTLFNPVFSHNGKTPLFFLNGNAFTFEATVFGAYSAVLVIAVLVWSKAYSRVVTSDKFLYLFGGVLPKSALVLSVALRYIPMLRKDAARLKDAGKTVGLYSKGSLTDNFLSSCRVYYALIGRTLENAVGTAESMRARGWGRAKRVPYSYYRFKKRDALVAAFSAVLLAVTLAASVSGALSFSFYPGLTAPPLSPLAAAAYGAFALYSLVPLILQTEVRLRWRSLQSKL